MLSVPFRMKRLTGISLVGRPAGELPWRETRFVDLAIRPLIRHHEFVGDGAIRFRCRLDEHKCAMLRLCIT